MKLFLTSDPQLIFEDVPEGTEKVTFSGMLEAITTDELAQEFDRQRDEYNNRLLEMQAQLGEMQSAHEAEKQKLMTAQQQLEEMKQTLSWKITAPLRKVRSLLGQEKE